MSTFQRKEWDSSQQQQQQQKERQGQTGSANFKIEDGMGRAASLWAVGTVVSPTPFPSQTKKGGTAKTTLCGGMLTIRKTASSGLSLMPAELHRPPHPSGILAVNSEKLLGGSDWPTLPLKEGGRGIRRVQHESVSPASKTCTMSRVVLEVWVGL